MSRYSYHVSHDLDLTHAVPLPDSKLIENSATKTTPTTSISPTKKTRLGTAWPKPGSSDIEGSRVSERLPGIRTRTCRSTMPRSSNSRITSGLEDERKRRVAKRESR